MTALIEALNISESPYVNASLSILAFILVAKLADLFVDKVLRRFASFTESDLDDRILDYVHRPIYMTISLIGVILAVIYLQPGERTEFYVNGILKSSIVIVWMLAAFKISAAVINDMMGKVSDVTGLSKDVQPLVINTAKVLLAIIAIGIMFSIWHINITPLLASAGIAGAALAFAAKDMLANLFGGVSVFFDKPYKVGDIIQLDKDRGSVVEIGLRSTRIKTPDNVLITVPNSVISNIKIVNESAPTLPTRLMVPVGVAYGTSMDDVDRALLAVAAEAEGVLKDPAPAVGFVGFGDSAINVVLVCWTDDPALKPAVTNRINRGIYRKFNETGIQIPFPQMDVNMKAKG